MDKPRDEDKVATVTSSKWERHFESLRFFCNLADSSAFLMNVYLSATPKTIASMKMRFKE